MPKRSRGFSLVELTAAMAASFILILGFGSVIVLMRQQLSATNIRVGLGYDQVLLDRYVRTKLTTTVSDSMQIFANANDELALITNTTGSILRAVDADSTVYHLAISSNTLEWMIDTISHNPVDCNVADLVFTESTGNFGKILKVTMNLVSDEDTLEAAWTITLRN